LFINQRNKNASQDFSEISLKKADKDGGKGEGDDSSEESLESINSLTDFQNRIEEGMEREIPIFSQYQLSSELELA
jgi:hypothetical protein